jgi:hypothetical protein
MPSATQATTLLWWLGQSANVVDEVSGMAETFQLACVYILSVALVTSLFSANFGYSSVM